MNAGPTGKSEQEQLGETSFASFPHLSQGYRLQVNRRPDQKRPWRSIRREFPRRNRPGRPRHYRPDLPIPKSTGFRM